MTRKDIRDLERSSIRDFVSKNAVYLNGRVLDFGCGKHGTCVQPQPYRRIVTGEYVPYEKGETFPAGRFGCVLMTQVLQYIENPARLLFDLRGVSDHLLMTYPTHWEEVERHDLWRFTKLGVEKMLVDAGWQIETHQQRWALPFEDFHLAGGYGVVAR